MPDDNFRKEHVHGKLEEHEMRITNNERFRLRFEGALTVISFALGGGFAVTVLAWLLGFL